MKLYMINKGELCMEYGNIDENAKYQEACKKVKQIADTIKKIRIKYYPNFSKISEADKQVYDELNNQIEKIAGENGLEALKVELISDITDKYNENSPTHKEDNQTDKTQLPDKVLKAYYGAIDAGKEVLSKGKIGQALKCQKKANEIMETLQEFGQEYVEMAIHYKREMFAELAPVKQRLTNWSETLKGFVKKEDAEKRKEFTQEFQEEIKGKDKEKQITSNELVVE